MLSKLFWSNTDCVVMLRISPMPVRKKLWKCKLLVTHLVFPHVSIGEGDKTVKKTMKQRLFFFLCICNLKGEKNNLLKANQFVLWSDYSCPFWCLKLCILLKKKKWFYCVCKGSLVFFCYVLILKMKLKFVLKWKVFTNCKLGKLIIFLIKYQFNSFISFHCMSAILH